MVAEMKRFGDLCRHGKEGLSLEKALDIWAYRLGALAMHWLTERAEEMGAPGLLAYWREIERTQEAAWDEAFETDAPRGMISILDHPALLRAELDAFEHAFGISRSDFFEQACEGVASGS